MQFDFGGSTQDSQDVVNRIQHPDALHGAQINGRPVVYFLSRQDRASHDVINIGPVPDLLTRTPDHERVLPGISASNHGNHGVVFDPARSVDGKVAAGR